MRGWARWLLSLEIAVCFLPCAAMLLMGTVMLPMQVVWLFDESSLDWEGAALVLIAVPCGVIGLCTLLFVVSLLFAGRERIEKPVPVLGGVLAGTAPLLLQVLLVFTLEGEADWWTLSFTVWLPLIATAHILYLSRHLFIEGFKHGQRPLISRGTWTTGALAICLAAFLLWLRAGIGYGALEERRAYWMQHRPAAYSYESSVSGWLKPRGLTYPKRVRVGGSEVTGASYVFGRSPGDTTQYPPPASDAWTMDAIFDALLDAKKHGARVSVRFDGATGAVLRARVDYEAPDASWGIEARNFRPLDAAAAQEPMPMFTSYK